MPYSEVCTVAGRRPICREGEPCDEFLLIREGWAFQYRTLPDGKRQILCFLLPGDHVPVQGLVAGRYLASVQALTDCTVYSAPRQKVEAWMQGQRAVSDWLGTLYVYESFRLGERILDLGRRSASERLARFFLEMEARLSTKGLAQSGHFHFPIRQQHLADSFGLTPIHVSRVMTELRSLGLLTLKQQTVTILDRKGLMALCGCDCDAFRQAEALARDADLALPAGGSLPLKRTA